MKRRVKAGLALVAVMAIAGAAFLPFDVIRRELYIREAEHRLKAVHSLNEARELAKDEQYKIWETGDGRWALGCAEYSCCAGAGYDAVVIRDSSGTRLVSRTINLCGGFEVGDRHPEVAPAGVPMAESWMKFVQRQAGHASSANDYEAW